ncbi:hypothetical protein Micbo1qcDRAFT_191506 [Microdochium bolleyi]|uniref:Uncharacterized protein n=1 Tax=Microdochium bolleyi TaxID=196109 RepID=A0A136JI98_9PEZI|nr:hypothetical protein Micbo1qcDRAFT_191506 [Microdochium bolleyi]
MGQAYNLLERPPSALAKSSSRFDQQMYGHLPYAPGMKPPGRDHQQGRHRAQRKVSPKSVSVDAEDLRRRLNIVLAEQNHQKIRRLQRQASDVDSHGKSKEHTDPSATAGQNQPSTARPNRQSSVPDLSARRSASMLQNKAPSPQKGHARSGEDSSRSRERDDPRTQTIVRSSSRAAFVPPRHSQSVQDLKRSHSMSTLKRPLASSSSMPYQHVPQDAATQFTRTATAQGMQRTQVVHPIARGALERQEQARLAERFSTPDLTSKTWSLKRTRSQNRHSAAYRRNQFQDANLTGDLRRNTLHEPGFDSITEIGMDNIFEDEEFVAKQKLQAARSREPENAREYAQIVNDHRIDWSQTDESVKKRSSLLLSFRSKKADTKTTAALQPASAATKNKNRMSTLPEKIDIPACSTQPLSSLKSPKSPLSFLSKFKRQQFIKV